MNPVGPESGALPRRFPFAQWGCGLIAIGVLVGASISWIGMRRAYGVLDKGGESSQLSQNIDLVNAGLLINSLFYLLGLVFLIVALVRRLRRA
jgi:hypothetical protein